MSTQTFKTFKLVETNSLSDFIKFWQQFYIDTEKDETLYRPAFGEGLLNDSLLLGYFEWKNQMTLSGPKKQSFNTKIGLKLNIINELRTKRESDFSLIQMVFEGVSTIWLIVLAHLINPEQFPIFDIHVFRAYQYIQNGTIDIQEYNNESKRLSLYKDKYLPFIEKLKQNSHTINNKSLDEALWAYGKFLSNYGTNPK
jgi:hypothetical protein